MLAKSEFMELHDKAVSCMHWKICKAFNLPIAHYSNDHNPGTVISNSQVTLVWDMQVHTDKEIRASKPDIIIKDHVNNIFQLIFFLFNIKIYKTRYLRLLDYKLLNYITRTITREARNHDYPKGHLGRNPITFDQIPTVLDSWIIVDVGYVGFGKVIGILP